MAKLTKRAEEKAAELAGACTAMFVLFMDKHVTVEVLGLIVQHMPKFVDLHIQSGMRAMTSPQFYVDAVEPEDNEATE